MLLPWRNVQCAVSMATRGQPDIGGSLSGRVGGNVAKCRIIGETERNGAGRGGDGNKHKGQNEQFKTYRKKTPWQKLFNYHAMLCNTISNEP